MNGQLKTINRMNISNIAAAASNQTQKQKQTAQTGSNSTLGKNGFLKLLVAQMRNQNPTNPMSGTKFATQLAQFNSVEQLINLNNGMSNLTKSQQTMSRSLSNTMAASLAGKKIKADTNKIHLQDGKDCKIPFELNHAATQATITIKDSAGNTVREVRLKNISAGNHNWSWNGKSNSGNSVPAFNYSVNVNAKKGNSQVSAITYQQGKAEKVRYTLNGVRLMINGVAIPLGNVKEIGV